MAFWILFCSLVVMSAAHIGDFEDDCPSYCVGEPYQCINGHCYCASGYMPNLYQTQCVKCPGLGEPCFGLCCSQNMTLQCWHGICQSCYGPNGNWICRDPADQIILISGTQIIMASALVLGIIATFILLYKLCAATTISPVGRSGSNGGSRLSVGSLQIYVDERLRDAPPRYTRSESSRAPMYPAAIYLNSGFVHDNTIPPPPYTPERKDENTQNATVHI
ncbi:uncharacterized protein LOC123693313 [Colias croceus]|uniref:uncharacterized protein LOC123693313 n=1 Tax=Colias crocea TaxID=72248 RepID=UPI001E27AAC7|nr:uncharacterized protein LOC123693313 [Colias croceus]